MDKNIAISELLREEKKIIEDRYQEELKRLRMDHEKAQATEKRDLVNVKNKNEKICRQIVDKEHRILELHSEVSVQQAEIKSLQQALDIAGAKVKALEVFSTNL